MRLDYTKLVGFAEVAKSDIAVSAKIGFDEPLTPVKGQTRQTAATSAKIGDIEPV